MKENEARLRSPEFRMISLVLFTPGPNDPRPTVTEEQIQERYEFRKAALADPEKRTFVTLTVPTKEAADKIAADLAATPPTADEIARVTEPLKQLITRASTGNGFYMFQLEGGATEPQKFTDLRSIL
ncbi:hypothetical protein LTR94_034353, partial [Friedmanniomyces endolithicus]